VRRLEKSSTRMEKNATLGIFIALAGTLCSAGGYTFQKLAHRRADVSAAAAHAASEAAAAQALRLTLDGALGGQAAAGGDDLRKPPPKAIPYYRFWQFPAGLGMLILGSVTAVFSFGLAGQAQLAPMSAVTLVWNELLAWRVRGRRVRAHRGVSCMQGGSAFAVSAASRGSIFTVLPPHSTPLSQVLRERFTRIDALSVVLMSVGTTIALVFAEKTDTSYSLDVIVQLSERPVVYIYSAVSLALVLLLAVLVARWGRKRPSELPASTAAADAFAMAFVAGMLGGYTGFLVKAVVEVFFGALRTGVWGAFTRVEPYVFLVLLVVVLWNQVRYMNGGLARYDSSKIIPIYQSTLVFSGVASGYVYWDEVAAQTSTSLALFGVGCACTIAGVAVLGLKPPTGTHASRRRGVAVAPQPLSSAEEAEEGVVSERTPMTAGSGGVSSSRPHPSPAGDRIPAALETIEVIAAAAAGGALDPNISCDLEIVGPSPVVTPRSAPAQRRAQSVELPTMPASTRVPAPVGDAHSSPLAGFAPASSASPRAVNEPAASLSQRRGAGGAARAGQATLRRDLSAERPEAGHLSTPRGGLAGVATAAPAGAAAAHPAAPVAGWVDYEPGLRFSHALEHRRAASSLAAIGAALSISGADEEGGPDDAAAQSEQSLRSAESTRSAPSLLREEAVLRSSSRGSQRSETGVNKVRRSVTFDLRSLRDDQPIKRGEFAHSDVALQPAAVPATLGRQSAATTREVSHPALASTTSSGPTARGMADSPAGAWQSVRAPPRLNSKAPPTSVRLTSPMAALKAGPQPAIATPSSDLPSAASTLSLSSATAAGASTVYRL